jgi:probable F420-dependent oxidoreductase
LACSFYHGSLAKIGHVHGRVRFGIVLPSREAAIAGNPSARRLVDLAVRAEQLGFDSAWTGDAPFSRPRFDPLTLLAAVAARTERLAVGTAIILPVLRHPLLFAHAVATVDRIAEGRFILGVGAGWVKSEFDAVGARFDQRVGRLLETIEICRTLWRAASQADPQPARFDGRYWSFDGIRLFPAPTKPDGPAVWLGGASEGVIKRAAAHFDGWFPNAPSPEAFAQGWSKLRDLAGDRAVTPALYVTVNVNPDARAAEQETSQYVLDYYGMPLEVMRKGQAYYTGNAAGCVQLLNGFVDAGVSHLAVRFSTLHPESQVELFAQEVLPAVT